MSRPISIVAKEVHKRVAAATKELGGLEDHHLKFISYFLRHELKIEQFALAVNYESTPKRILVSVYGKDGQDVFLKPKHPDMLDKIIKHLNIPLWEIKFRESSLQT